jgi:hypothetical protein
MDPERGSQDVSYLRQNLRHRWEANTAYSQGYVVGMQANLFWHRRVAELAKRMNIEQNLPDNRVEPYIPQTRSEHVSSSRSPPGFTCACICRTSRHIAITESRRRSRGMKAKAKAESRIEEDLVLGTLNCEYVQVYQLPRLHR